MSVSTVATAGTYDKGNVVSQWSAKIAREYIKEEEFSPWTGKSEGAVFQVKEELTKKAGDNITFSLVGKLSNPGVEGDDTLEGAEEPLNNWADTVSVNQLRNAVLRGDHEQSKTLIQILNEARYMLKKWAMEQMRDLKIARLTSPHLDGVTTFAAATLTERNAWDTQNGGDRILYGELISNRSAGDHSASLLNVDATADTLKRSIISKAKRMAESASPLIRPMDVKGVRQYFIAFCGTNPHRDLKIDLDTIHATAAPREKGMSNPIWRDDDLMYEDVVIRKVPAMTSPGNLGAASAPIYLVAFCGAQAVLVAYAKHLRAIRNGPEGQDYGNMKGVGVAETRGAKKAIFNQTDHGMLSIYVASEADA